MSAPEEESQPDEQPETVDYLTFATAGDVVEIQAVVDGETVFYAAPDPERSNPVVQAALRTWGRRAFPELAGDGEEGNGDGEHTDSGAFQ